MTREWNGAAVAEQLSSLLDSLAGSDEPGMAIGVYRDGILVASAAVGRAVVEHGVPITEHTAFDIASVSKHMTATCMLLLARDGLIHLDEDIRALLPELSLTRSVTLRHCLTHTGGLRDYFALCDLSGIPVMGMREDRFLHLVAGQRELDFVPGSAFSYSNTGYVIAAALARRVTGDSLTRFASQRVFDPLGMRATQFRDDVSVLVPRLANGYLIGPDGFRRCDVTEEVVGDGAVITTIADLAAWHGFMCSGTVLGTDIRDGLLARQTLTDGIRLDYALGIEAIDVAGGAAWWHSGSWAGYRSAVLYLPADRAGVSVLANRNDHNASQVALAVARALATGEDLRSCLEDVRGIPAPLDVALRQRGTVAGLWHEGDQDHFLELQEVEPGEIAVRAHGEEYRFRLGTDGTWHGVGAAGGGTYSVRDGTLIAGWGLSARAEGRYRRVPDADGPQVAPAGTYRSDELSAYADVVLDTAGTATITIGLAAPRLLEPAGPDVWRGDGLTMRVQPADSSLLVSTPGACRLRFVQVAKPPADRGMMRGLRSWHNPS